MKNYIKFLGMIGVSAIIMFGIMYLNTYSFEDVFFSQTRLFMTLMMVGAMAIIMILSMWKMYKSKIANVGILITSIIIFAASLFAVRTQFGIGDIAWMKAMIPHHSIAILTSSKANLSDPRVKELAQKISISQKSEIEEMKALIKDLKSNEVAINKKEDQPKPENKIVFNVREDFAVNKSNAESRFISDIDIKNPSESGQKWDFDFIKTIKVPNGFNDPKYYEVYAKPKTDSSNLISFYEYNILYQDQNNETIWVNFSEKEEPFTDYELSQDDELSKINNQEVNLSKHEKGYRAKFTYNNINFLIEASAMNEDDFVSLVSSVIKL